MTEPQVCVDKLPKLPANAKKRMGVLKGMLWNGQNRPDRTPLPLLVGFLDGSAALRRRVMAVAREWTKYAHVEFLVVEDLDRAQILISFTFEPGVSWSLIGRDCLTAPENEPTMNLGKLSDRTDQTTLRRVVLHEFGHALGCIHEHSQPGARIPWNEEKVYEFYASIGWPKKRVKLNILKRYTNVRAGHSGFDAKSVMLYPVLPDLTDGKFKSGWNTKLSAKDKAFIRRMYPRPRR